MSFKCQIPIFLGRTGCLAAALLVGVAPHGNAERLPSPSVRLPLETLGFPGYTTALMHAGASMATVHLLDSSHLLFTYSLRTLVPRLPGDDEHDTDRLVAAEVVELPSGNVLARDVWHLHDHGQYLWTVGHGLFVLRMGDSLSTFTPLRGLASGTAFRRVALLHRAGRPMLIAGSPDGQILMLELQRDVAPSEETQIGDSTPVRRTTLEFYRAFYPAASDEAVQLRPAGAVGSPGLIQLALDGDGYLWAEDGKRNRWKLSFNEYAGKPQELTAIASTCTPRLDLVSRSQFLVTTCRGSDDTHLLSAYGFDGHETWEEPYGDIAQQPQIATAPEAGRFALSRVTAPGTGGAVVSGAAAAADTLNQEIRVYQTESGDLLLDLQCAPVVRSGGNFDLSPDGRELAVLGKTAIEIYRLPELTARDRKDLAQVKTMEPPVTTGPVVLGRIVRRIEAPEGETTTARRLLPPAASESAPGAVSASVGGSTEMPAATGTTAAPATAEPATAAVSASQVAAVAPATTEAAGDPSPAHRKPPTLLGPGEKPEFKGPSEPAPN